MMAKYSITINFFIPKEIVVKLKKVKISGDIFFDWRSSNLCHCTIKAIYLGDKIPKKIEQWSKDCEKVFAKQKPFHVEVKDIARFPTTIFANIHSKELIKLHKKICSILPSSQPEYENEKYVPHASVVVTSKKADVLSNKKQEFGKFKVEEIQLMVWDLNNLKEPRVYKRFLLKLKKS